MNRSVQGNQSGARASRARQISFSASNGGRVGVRCRPQRNADSFRQDLHPDLKADFIHATPPFNMSDWGGENLRQDVRWKFGLPPVNNANYAWIQHFIHHLSPRAWLASSSSMSSRQDRTVLNPPTASK